LHVLGVVLDAHLVAGSPTLDSPPKSPQRI
jgi:hypothetical protein